MGNTYTQEDNIIKNRKNDCEKFNACNKDKLYKELTRNNNSPMRKYKSFRKTKTKTKKFKRTKSKMSH
jgi:hypothetical protein